MLKTTEMNACTAWGGTLSVGKALSNAFSMASSPSVPYISQGLDSVPFDTGNHAYLNTVFFIQSPNGCL